MHPNSLLSENLSTSLDITLADCVLFEANFADDSSCVAHSKCILSEFEMKSHSTDPRMRKHELIRCYFHLLHYDRFTIDYLPCTGIHNIRDVAELKIRNRLSSLWI